MHRAASNVYDAFEFLELLGGQLNKNFMYHVPCHLKTQGFGTPAADILREIPGTKVTFENACSVPLTLILAEVPTPAKTNLPPPLIESVKSSAPKPPAIEKLVTLSATLIVSA